MSENSGVTPPIPIGGEDFTLIRNIKISPVEGDGESANPPMPNGNQPSEAMYAYNNNYGEFVFRKITAPDYGDEKSLARITGMPENIPDYIADFHFIGMARAIDDMMQHRYKGTIDGTMDTPKSTD